MSTYRSDILNSPLAMVCAQVFGCHATVLFAGSQGHLELNAYKPVIAWNVLRSIALLADASRSFAARCVAGLEPDAARLAELVGRSLMLVTALVPRLGYDRAAALAHAALRHGTTLREETLASGHLTAEEFDRLVRPEGMVGPP